MLQEMEKLLISRIYDLISRIDAAVSAMEAAVEKIRAEREAVEQLLDMFESADTNGTKSYDDPQIEIMKRFIDELLEEKEWLFELRCRLDRCSERRSWGSLAADRGGMICVMPDELLEKAHILEKTTWVISANIDRLRGIADGIVVGKDSLEIDRMLAALGDYRASAMHLMDACYETAKYLRKMREEYEACENTCSGLGRSSRGESFSRGGAGNSSSGPQACEGPDLAIPPLPVGDGKAASGPVGGSQENTAREQSADTRRRSILGEIKSHFPSFGRRYKSEKRNAGDDINRPLPCPPPYNEQRNAGETTVISSPKEQWETGNIRDERAVPPPQIDSVQFSAIAANFVVPGKYLPISIVMYEDAFRTSVEDIIREHGDQVKETKSGYQDVERNATVRVVLRSSDVIIEDNEEIRKWNGKYLNFEFVAKVPSDFAEDQILLTATVYINDLIATKLRLVLDREKKSKQSLSVEREDIASAFVSYASQDRNRVASIIQGMKKARPDMDIFFDIESLRSGQRWENVLKSEIENRDVLFLCWSRYARASKWVEMEWRYALESKGEESIEPIPIDSPDVCPPPIELQQKHFNDKMLFIIKAAMPAEVMQPYLLRIKTNERMPIVKTVVYIGSDASQVDLLIRGNAAVSPRHAQIIFRGGNYFIMNMNFRSPTYVDGQAISRTVGMLIEYGSKIMLADEEFEFYC